MVRYIGKTSMVKIFNVKVGTFLLLILVTAWNYNQPYLEFMKEHQQPISWCIFPFYLTSFVFLALFYIGIIYINSDVPFMQHANMYQMIRTGRMRWAAGQIGGIFVRSLVVAILSAILVTVPFLGRLELKNEWGKVVYTLASEHPLSSDFFLDHILEFRFFHEIIEKYTPLQLMVITVLLCSLICTFLGVLMFLISLFAARVISVAAGFGFILALFCVENADVQYRQVLAHFIPTYWGEVALIATPSSGYYRLPPLTYMFTFLLAAIAVMSAAICLRVKRIEFNWENEDM